MDLAEWAKDPYDAVVAEVDALAARLGIVEPIVVPVSALHGDNVVDPSDAAPWYEGPTVLGALEAAPAGGGPGEGTSVAASRSSGCSATRRGGRTYAGMVDGRHRPRPDGPPAPRGHTTTIRRVATADGDLAVARVGRCVDVDLDRRHPRGPWRHARDRAAARGHRPPDRDGLLVRRGAAHGRPAFRVKHTTRSTVGFVDTSMARLDVNELTLAPADSLEANDIGVVTISTADPLVVDPYTLNRITGSFVLVDERTNATLAGGDGRRPHLRGARPATTGSLAGPTTARPPSRSRPPPTPGGPSMRGPSRLAGCHASTSPTRARVRPLAVRGARRPRGSRRREPRHQADDDKGRAERVGPARRRDRGDPRSAGPGGRASRELGRPVNERRGRRGRATGDRCAPRHGARTARRSWRPRDGVDDHDASKPS